MSTDPKEPPTGVDPSEKPITDHSGGKDKDKDKDRGGGHDKDKQAPSAGSKGINPVQHSE